MAIGAKGLFGVIGVSSVFRKLLSSMRTPYCISTHCFRQLAELRRVVHCKVKILCGEQKTIFFKMAHKVNFAYLSRGWGAKYIGFLTRRQSSRAMREISMKRFLTLFEMNLTIHSSGPVLDSHKVTRVFVWLFGASLQYGLNIVVSS
jgi:hypothetical protein